MFPPEHYANGLVSRGATRPHDLRAETRTSTRFTHYTKAALFLVRNQVYLHQKMSVSVALLSYHVYHVSSAEVSYLGVAQVNNFRSWEMRSA